MNNIIFVDAESIYSDRRKLVVKEVAFIINNSLIEHYILKTPSKISTRKMQLTNRWLYQKRHRLCNLDGDTTSRKMREDMKQYANHRIVSKGLEKCKILTKLLKRRVFNIEDFIPEFPSYNNLPQNNEMYCEYHLNYPSFWCAVNKAVILKEYAEKNYIKELNDNFEIRSVQDHGIRGVQTLLLSHVPVGN